MTPIIRRELLDALRTRQAILLQVGLALACALLVLVRWPTGETTDLSGARSLQVLRVFGFGLLAGILLLVPAFPATSIVREKVKGTLALLLNSPLSPLNIYLGKLIGSLGFTAVLLIMTLPAAAACHALGGSGSQGGILALYGVLALAAVQLTTLALLVSSRAQTTDGALRATYALALALVVLTQLPYTLMRGLGDSPLLMAASWLRCVSPVPAVLEILGQSELGAAGFSDSMRTGWRYVILAILSSLLFAYLTLTRLNHKLLDRARAAGVMTDDRSAVARAGRRVFFLIDPQRRSGPMWGWMNPVLVKEFRSRRFGRSHWMMRLLALSAILSLGISCLALVSGALPFGIEAVGGALVLLQVILLVLFAPSLAAGLISSERESGSWQLLRMTPLSTGAILRGKLMSVAWPLFLLLCATLPGYIVLMTIKPTYLPQLQRVLVCLVLTAVFGVLLSAAISTLFRTSAAATTASYLALLAVCVGPLLVWLGRDAPFGHLTVQRALTINPVAAALQASEMPGFTGYDLVPANWWVIGLACVLLLVFLSVRVWQLNRPE